MDPLATSHTPPFDTFLRDVFVHGLFEIQVGLGGFGTIRDQATASFWSHHRPPEGLQERTSQTPPPVPGGREGRGGSVVGPRLSGCLVPYGAEHPHLARSDSFSLTYHGGGI